MNHNNMLEGLVILCAAIKLVLHWREMHYQRHRNISATDRHAGEYTLQRLRVTAWLIVFEALFVIAMIGQGLDSLVAFWHIPSMPAWLMAWAVLMSAVWLQATLHRVMALIHIWLVERPFGFSQQSVSTVVKDTLLKAGLLLLSGGALGLMSISALAQGWDRGWPWLIVIWTVFVWIRAWLYPLVVAPLFNDYQPVTDPRLMTQLRRLGQQAGVRIRSLLVMDGSRRSSHGNARVTGVGSTKRVILLDTLQAVLDRNEVVAVIAHEVGHLKARHMRYYQLYTLLASILWITLFALLAGRLGLTIGAGLGLLWLLTPTMAFLIKPLFTQLIRGYEYEADAFAVHAGYGQFLARALVKLNRNNATAEQSDPWFAWVYHAHPLLEERLARLSGKGPVVGHGVLDT